VKLYEIQSPKKSRVKFNNCFFQSHFFFDLCISFSSTFAKTDFAFEEQSKHTKDFQTVYNSPLMLSLVLEQCFPTFFSPQPTFTKNFIWGPLRHQQSLSAI